MTKLLIIYDLMPWNSSHSPFSDDSLLFTDWTNRCITSNNVRRWEHCSYKKKQKKRCDVKAASTKRYKPRRGTDLVFAVVLLDERWHDRRYYDVTRPVGSAAGSLE